MKIATNPMGLFDYTVTGDREDEAAAALEKRLDAISRDIRSTEVYRRMDTHDAVNKTALEYGVEIGTTV